jgi:hypothetical protein
MQKRPDDPRLRDTLKHLLQAYYVRRAAKQGVFICYARDDELFALDLTTDLRKAGVKAFMDEIDIDITMELEWGQAIGKAMRICGVLLLVLSPDAIHDAEVQGERIYFLNHGKIVIPVTARECTTHGLEMFIQPIDFENDYQTGLQELLQLLTQPTEAST